MTRIDGTLSTWNDERGFGFITPSGGGEQVFVHISAFSRDSLRPEPGDVLSFQPRTAADGRVRAVRVRGPGNVVGAGRPAPAVVGYLVIAAFIALAMYLSTLWPIPWWSVVPYAGMSVLCFAVYAFDKSAARKGRWRVSEATLLFLGLACGWPGSVLAQQWLRHKRRKASFLGPFWVTVAVNVSAFALVTSPLFQEFVGQTLES